jgi:hypothetical protein
MILTEKVDIAFSRIHMREDKVIVDPVFKKVRDPILCTPEMHFENAQPDRNDQITTLICGCYPHVHGVYNCGGIGAVGVLRRGA